MHKFIPIVLAICLFISCKKESKTETVCPPLAGGNMIVGDSTFSLQPTIIIENMGKSTNGFFNDSTSGLLYLVNFLDSRLTLNPDTTLDVQYYRQHIPVITLPCYTSNPDSLPSGTYRYFDSEPYPINSFSWGVIGYNYIYEQGGGTFNFRYPDIKSGTLVIDHLCKEKYRISLNATLKDGGLFKGSIVTKIILTDSR